MLKKQDKPINMAGVRSFCGLLIPGEVILAARMAMGDIDDWLKRDMADKWVREVYLKPGPTEPIILQRSEEEIRQPKDPFNAYAKIYSVEGSDFTILYEFTIEVNRRVYGLVNSLTPRWRAVLWKRLVEHKSITKTAEEMQVKPQAVVAFMASIRKAVQKHLYQSRLVEVADRVGLREKVAVEKRKA